MNTPNEDPRITAYLTNELSADERTQFEQDLQSDNDLVAEVEEMRELFSLVGAALETEPCPQLYDADRAALLQTLPENDATTTSRRPRIRPITIRLAACAAVLCVGMTVWLVNTQTGRQVAHATISRAELRERGDMLVEDIAQATAGMDRTEAMEPTATSPHLAVTPAPPGIPSENPKFGDQRRLADYDGLSGKVIEELAGENSMEDSSSDRPVPERINAQLGRDVINAPTASILALTLEPPEKMPPGNANWNREAYNPLIENNYRSVSNHPLSTFSIDVDTASYANMRRFITNGQLPPKDAVRIEELINYFDYDYPEPRGDHPFSVGTEIVDCPWNANHRLARIGLKGRSLVRETAPACNLVFLIDVSGSMGDANKLPLLKDAMKMLAENLRPEDTIAITVYAGSAGLVLPPTSGRNRHKIIAALDRLQSGGSTNGGAGIHLAYKVAQESFVQGGANRVILASDGDFNVGTTDQGSLIKLITEKAKSGVFLTVLGFGMGNYQDARLEQVANKGNGNYAYIDNRAEARKVLVEQMNGTLVTIAKDVKIQVEFNPAQVAGYRLIGYENRILKKEDFNNDKKDAGEIGAGHTVTALYEIVPKGVRLDTPTVDPLKYQSTTTFDNYSTRLVAQIRHLEAAGGRIRIGQKATVTVRQGTRLRKITGILHDVDGIRAQIGDSKILLSDLSKADADALRFAKHPELLQLTLQQMRGELAKERRQATAAAITHDSGESLTVKLRYKEPAEHVSKLIEHPVTDEGIRYANASPDMKFAASVASFGMLLRDSPYRGNSSFEGIQELAEEGALRDPHGYRAAFIQLVKRARTLHRR